MASSDDDAKRMATLLQAIGFRAIRGYLSGGITAWQDARLPIETTAAVDPATVAEQLKRDEAVLLDVREDDEWDRSSIAASLLRRHGVDRLEHVVDGGVQDLSGEGIELRQGARVAT